MFHVLRGLQVVFVRVLLKVQVMNVHAFWSTFGIGSTFIIFIFLSPSHNFLPFFISETCSCFLVYFWHRGHLYFFSLSLSQLSPFLSFRNLFMLFGLLLE